MSTKIKLGQSGDNSAGKVVTCHNCFRGYNVYLLRADLGLGTRYYAGLNCNALHESLQLRTERAVIFRQAVRCSK